MIWRCLLKSCVILLFYFISQCFTQQELLDWVDVGPEQTHYTYQELPYNERTQFVFAVSANTKSMSSGMVVATCELINDKGKSPLWQQKYGMNMDKEYGPN